MKYFFILMLLFLTTAVFAQYRTTTRHGNTDYTYDYGTNSYSTTTYYGPTSTTYDYGTHKYTTCTQFGNMINCY